MGYSHAVRHGVLKKVLPPESRSIAQVSQETGVNEQTIRNWLKQSKSGILPNEKKDSSPRSLTPKEKYQLVVEAAGIDDEHLGEFLRERGLHSEHLTIWDQELREMIDAKKDRQLKENRALKQKVRLLEKDLLRKNKALAEATALLVLKKKLETLLTDNEED
jgi:transposase-like protein